MLLVRTYGSVRILLLGAEFTTYMQFDTKCSGNGKMRLFESRGSQCFAAPGRPTMHRITITLEEIESPPSGELCGLSAEHSVSNQSTAEPLLRRVA